MGPAGSGKTLFACAYAARELKLGNIKKLIITRPIVCVDEELGFLPGSLNEKMNPWTRPIFDILVDFFKQGEIDSMVREGIIEISPLAYMRGRTFKHACIIADEMQNSSPNQMMMMTTRIGDDSKMIITGDLAQSDRAGNNGLSEIIGKIRLCNNDIDNNPPFIRLIELGDMDIQRSPIVAKILKLYSSDNKQNINSMVKRDGGFDDAALMPKRDCIL